MSRPAWARGLKLDDLASIESDAHVAPRVGAWIETLTNKILVCHLLSRPAWARGLKLTAIEPFLIAPGRAPRGRVD